MNTTGISYHGNEFYIRAKHLNNFTKYYPEIDASVPLKVKCIDTNVNIEWKGADDTYRLFEPEVKFVDGRRPSSISVVILAKGYSDAEYSVDNPVSSKGYWYINEINYKYIVDNIADLAYIDKPVTNFVVANIYYEDKEKYGAYYRRSIMVPIEDVNRLRLDKDRISDKIKKNYVMIESKSNPRGYEYARLGQLSWRESKTITDDDFMVLDRKILAGPAETRKHMEEEGYIPVKERTRPSTRPWIPTHDYTKNGIPQGSILQVSGKQTVSNKLNVEAVQEADVPAEKYHALEYENERLKALVVEQALEISELKKKLEFRME